MSNIHYFPRYSQKENMVTNNTLLLFSQLYNNSTVKKVTAAIIINGGRILIARRPKYDALAYAVSLSWSWS